MRRNQLAVDGVSRGPEKSKKELANRAVGAHTCGSVDRPVGWVSWEGVHSKPAAPGAWSRTHYSCKKSLETGPGRAVSESIAQESHCSGNREVNC